MQLHTQQISPISREDPFRHTTSFLPFYIEGQNMRKDSCHCIDRIRMIDFLQSTTNKGVSNRIQPGHICLLVTHYLQEIIIPTPRILFHYLNAVANSSALFRHVTIFHYTNLAVSCQPTRVVLTAACPDRRKMSSSCR